MGEEEQLLEIGGEVDDGFGNQALVRGFGCTGRRGGNAHNSSTLERPR